MRILVLLGSIFVLAACAAPSAPPTSMPIASTVSQATSSIAPTPTREPRLAETRGAETRAAEPSPTNTPSATTAIQKAATVPDIRGVFGSPITFATHAELANYGFVVGPSDGQFGAIPSSNGNYTFYGVAGSSTSCKGTPNARDSTYTFTGTLDHVTGSNCTKLFGPGDGPTGWIFDRNYAGGGQVVRFAEGDKSGWLMTFHGEVWWENPATSDHTCNGIAVVPCFYSSLGLAVSIDDGKTFKVVGQIFQPTQPLSAYMGKGTDLAVGYGSLIVADANGQHLDDPPANPDRAYFYLFFTDLLAGSPGGCATAVCIGVERAPYGAVVVAALSNDPHKIATVFHKYDGASQDPWIQPSTSDTTDESGVSGTFTPLWMDQAVVSPAVIYDSSFNLYLVAYHSREGIEVRASNDLIHWSGPIGTPYSEAGQILYTTTLIGETGNPIIGGPSPRVFFSSFPAAEFPNWKHAVLESVPLTLSRGH